MEGSDTVRGISAVHIPLLNQLVCTNTEEVQKILENSYKNKL